MKHDRSSKRLGQSNRFVGKMMALDKFAYTVPSFNLRGDQKIKTSLGALCSVAISTLVLFYALLKFIQLQERHNPTISTFTDDTIYDFGNPLNLNKINSKAAFVFTGWSWAKQAFEAKEDPNLVKMIVRMTGLDLQGNYYERIIPHHKCTDEDFQEFYPIVGEQSKEFETKHSAVGFNCIDWDDEDPYMIYGNLLEGAFQSFNVMLVTCNYKTFSGHDAIQPGCSTDIQKQKEYIKDGDLYLNILHNQERLDTSKFG